MTPAVVARGAALGEPGQGQLLGWEGDVQALAVIVRTGPSDAGGSGELSGSSPLPASGNGSWTMSALH